MAALVAKLTIRPFKPSDVESIVRYFYAASPTDLERMGVEAAKLPPEDEMRQSLLKVATIHAEKSLPSFPGRETAVGNSYGIIGSSCYLIWEVDGHAIGYSSLKDIVPEKRGGMHLHMWDAASRGKGFGPELFCRSALEFYRLYNLELIVCEPRAANPMPNRMLQKIGFPHVHTFVGRSSSLSAETELNRYEIRREVAASYLKKLIQLQ